MRVKVPSYAPVGIEAVAVDVVVDGRRAKVVEPKTRHVLHLVRPESIESASSVIEYVVNGRTLAQRRSAPARSITGLYCPVSPFTPEFHNMKFILLDMIE
jgi:hypothetical protein